MYSPYTNTRDASDVIYRNDYRTRYFGYYGKLLNTVNAIVNIIGGSAGENEASEVTYLYMGRTMITDEELRYIFASELPPVIKRTSTIWYNPSTTPLSTVTYGGITYMVDGSSTLYWFKPNGTYVFTDTIPPCLTGVAIDSSGILYIVDSANSKIYALQLTISEPPVSPVPVDLHITGITNPTKIAVTSTCRIFILEQGASTIKSAYASSVATIIAGSTAGFADGVGTSAKFNKPMGFVLDSIGTFMYIADTDNSLIRKMVVADYTVSTIAGNITAFSSPFPTDNVGNKDGLGIHGESLLYHPEGITLSPSGLLYIADSSNNNIRQITLDGTLTTLAGMPGVDPIFDVSQSGYIDGPNAISRWNVPVDIQYYNNILVVSEPLNHAVRVLPLL